VRASFLFLVYPAASRGIERITELVCLFFSFQPFGLNLYRSARGRSSQGGSCLRDRSRFADERRDEERVNATTPSAIPLIYIAVSVRSTRGVASLSFLRLL